MTDITYDKTIVPPAAVAKPTRKSFWQRAFDAMIEARMRQAERLVREYQELAKR